MGERKVLNKYFSPDFDPTKVPRRKMDYDGPQEVRMMLPFNMRCLTCRHFMYRGKKFNSKKETAMGEEYLGIKIFRFWVKCEACRAPISFKTDPKNADYTCETGATRNVDLIRGQGVGRDDVEDGGEVADGTKGGGGVRAEPVDDVKDDGKDALEILERRTLESKREIDTLDQLDEIRTKNKAREKVSTDDVLGKLDARHKNEQAKAKSTDAADALVSEDQLEELAKKAFQAKREKALVAAKKLGSGKDGGIARTTATVPSTAAAVRSSVGDLVSARKPGAGSGAGGGVKRGLQLPKGAVVLRRKLNPRVEEGEAKKPVATSGAVGIGLGALAGYGSSSSSDDSDDDDDDDDE